MPAGTDAPITPRFEAVGGMLDVELIIGQHQAITRAVRRHQRTGAERAMRQHIEYMMDVLRSADA